MTREEYVKEDSHYQSTTVSNEDDTHSWRCYYAWRRLAVASLERADRVGAKAWRHRTTTESETLSEMNS